jgi:hypothetical protein
MAQIRVAREKRSNTWVWVLVAVVVLAAVVLLLHWAGYINLPVRLGVVPAGDTMGLAGAAALLKGGEHGQGS